MGELTLGDGDTRGAVLRKLPMKVIYRKLPKIASPVFPAVDSLIKCR